MITSDASVIEKAADLGINYFDSARGYQSGNNERMVGAALKGKRKNLILSTKTGAGNRQGALEHLETSLKELGTDYIDIWYLHGKGSIARSDRRVDRRAANGQEGGQDPLRGCEHACGAGRADSGAGQGRPDGCHPVPPTTSALTPT